MLRTRVLPHCAKAWHAAVPAPTPLYTPTPKATPYPWHHGDLSAAHPNPQTTLPRGACAVLYLPGHLGVAELLLDRDADPNAVTINPVGSVTSVTSVTQPASQPASQRRAAKTKPAQKKLAVV